MGFSGFDSSELAGVVIVRQQKGTIKPISIVVGSTKLSAGSDTVRIFHSTNTSVYYALDYSIDPNYDYLIQVLPTGQVHTLTGISIKQVKSYDTDHDCTNPVEYYFDGTRQFADTWIHGVQAGPRGSYGVIVTN